MKAAEEAGFEHLTPAILGENCSIYGNAAPTVALFAAIMVAVADLDDPRTSGVSFEERNHIMTMKAPPPNWHLFIGRVDDENWRTHFRHWGMSLHHAAPVETVGCNSQVTTMALGQLVIHGVSAPADIEIIDTDSYARLLELQTVWPLAGAIDTTNLRVLRNNEADLLADGLFGSLDPEGYFSILNAGNGRLSG